MVLKTPAESVALRMPPYYGLCVLVGVGGFAVVQTALIGLYGWLTWTGLWPFLHRDFTQGTGGGALLRIGLGLLMLLLTWRSWRATESWPGIEVTKGSCPPLEDLVAGCAAHAGVEPPDAVYVTPDCNIAAFSLGVVRGSGQHANFINIGAMLLPGLSRSELEAAIFHEFAHLVMRKKQWAVALDTRIREFVPRLRVLNRRGGRGFMISIKLGQVLLLWYWKLYNLLMAPLRRREELLADDFAAVCCGREDYGRRLTVIMALQRVFEDRLADAINGNFHVELLGMPAAPKAEDWPNWFALAAKAFSDPIRALLEYTLKDLRDSEEQTLLAEHPTLRRRLERLGTEMPATAQELTTDEPGVAVGETWQRQISASFGDRMRPEFYEAKQRAGIGKDVGFTAESVTCYPCRWAASCETFGKTNLELSQRGMRWTYKNGSVDDIAWSDLAEVKVLPDGKPSGSSGPMISRMFAMYDGMPSMGEVQVIWPQRPDGKVSTQTLQVFHLRENMQEAMDLIAALWDQSRQIAAAAPLRDMPVLLGELKEAVASETAPAAQPELVARQRAVIQEAYRRNVGMRWAEFSKLLQLYEGVLNKAEAAETWGASVTGRQIVLEQLSMRQTLRMRIRSMGAWSLVGRLLWLPVWVRVAVAAAIAMLLVDAGYSVFAWRHRAGASLMPFLRNLFSVAWVHTTAMVAVILFALALAARVYGLSVMEDLEITEIRALNARTEQGVLPSQKVA